MGRGAVAADVGRLTKSQPFSPAGVRAIGGEAFDKLKDEVKTAVIVEGISYLAGVISGPGGALVNLIQFLGRVGSFGAAAIQPLGEFLRHIGGGLAAAARGAADGVKYTVLPFPTHAVLQSTQSHIQEP